MRKSKHALMLLAASAALTACVDELSLDAPSESRISEVYFTASIAEQDFFGSNRSETRSASDERQRVQAGFYRLPVDGRDDIVLSVSTLDGMFGKSSPLPEDGKENVKTRGTMLTAMEQKPMTVIEEILTSANKLILGDVYKAYTEDGFTWGGSHRPSTYEGSEPVSRTIYAFYPQQENNSYVVDRDHKSINYIGKKLANQQEDLLFAQVGEGLGSQMKDSLHLAFNHLLTAVRFKIGSSELPMEVIDNISIEGIYTSGHYSLDKYQWEYDKATGSVSCPLTFYVQDAENIIINTGDNTFMLLPQQLTPDAKVKIDYRDLDEEGCLSQTKTLTASLATDVTPVWEAGQCITYTLMDKAGESEYILDIEAPETFSADGDTQELEVVSYRHVEGVRYPMRWMVQGYSSDGGKSWMSGGASNVPKYMSFAPSEGTGEEPTKVQLTLLASEKICAPHRDFLRYKTPLGYDGKAFDLSRHDYLNQPCAQTTANCYVVDAPGKYRIPTAYGNGIVNGATNKAAYTDVAGYRHSNGKNFMTHHGQEIMAPMIQNNGITISRAALVWEDVQDLIDPESIQLVDGGDAIEFEILADTIDQGNAVIAAMDGNNVVWSWHIWVTDEKASLATPIQDQNRNGMQVDFMPLTLGWCSTSRAWGQVGREAAVRITMPGHLSSRASIRIHQVSSPSLDLFDNTIGNATYYNWGRKDPFPGAVSTDKPIGSDENAQALPKPFYQAGADAAALGLHSELHTEYGSNAIMLLLQGAAVGLNGYLTGITIGQMINYFKSGTLVSVPDGDPVETYKISEEPLENFELIYNTDREYRREFQDLMTWSAEAKSKLPESVKQLVPGIDQPGKYSVDYFTNPIGRNGGVNHTGYKLYDKVQKKFTIAFKATKIGNDGFKVSAHAINYVTEQHFTLVSKYSSAFLVSAGKALTAAGIVGGALANSSLFSGGTEWCREMKSHGMPINYGILHPNIPMRDPISWVNHDGFGNLWNAAQIDYDDTVRTVVKSIYDPCPAGYRVPSARDMNNFNDKTTTIGTGGATAKTATSGRPVNFPALGVRNFWSASEPGATVNNNINELIFFNGAQGMYWTCSPAINEDESGENGGYAVNFRGSDSYDDHGKDEGFKYSPRVINDVKLQSSYALPIKPVREQQAK